MATYLDELKSQTEKDSARVKEIHDTINQSQVQDENGEVTTSLSQEAVEGLLAEATDLNERMDKRQPDIDQLEKIEAARRRDENLAPFAGVNLTKERQVSDFNSLELGPNRKVEGAITGRTIGEAVVEAATELDRNDLARGFDKLARSGGVTYDFIMDPHTHLLLEQNDVNLTELPLANVQMFGIEVAMASGYFIDLLPVVNGSGRVMQWNESPSVPSPANFRRTYTSNDPNANAEVTPTTLSRAMAPSEFGIDVDIARSTLRERSDAAAWINQNLSIAYKRETSPEAGYTGSDLTGIIGVGHANLRDMQGGVSPGLLHEDGAFGTATDDANAVKMMDAILKLRDRLAGQMPGRKTCAIHRGLLTAMQEARATNDSAQRYPSLSNDIPTYGDITFVPIDVGLPTVAEDTFGVAVLMDFATNSQHLVADREVFVNPYIERSKGNHRFTLDGKSGYIWLNRFGIGLLQA